MERPHAALAKHQGLWRVDGIGPVEQNVRLGARISVCFSGLSEDGLNKPYISASLNGLTLKLLVHTAWIQRFKVGSIWRNGLSVAQPGEMERTVTIDVDRARSLPLTHSVNLDGQWADKLLPNFDIGENRTSLASSQYSIVPVLNDPYTKWLVIPESELLRFYAGASSRILSSALQGGIDEYVDWNRCDIEEGAPLLCIKKDINRQESALLARACISERAKEALYYPHKELALTSHYNSTANAERPLVLKGIFPFTGTTQLSVSGKRMLLCNKNDDPQWSIFAMEINHCSKESGFSKIIIIKDEGFPAASKSSDPAADAIPQRFRALMDDEEDEEDEAFDDVPADQRLGRLVVLSYTNQFSAFKDLTLEHRRPHEEHRRNIANSPIDISVKALTLEDGSYSKDAQGNLGVSLFQNQDYQIDRELQLFIEMLAELRLKTAHLNWKIRTRKIDGAVSYNGEDIIASFPEKIGKKRTWHKIADSEGNERPRKVVWTEIATDTNQKFFYLFEMELKPGESGQCTLLLHQEQLRKMDDQLFRELLFLTAIQNRWPTPDNKWTKKSHQYRANKIFTDFITHRIRHPSATKPTNDNNHTTTNNVSPREWATLILERIFKFIPPLDK
ncbi:MAG: hypothetical protein ACK5NQ_02745 [Pseudomonas sp.]